MRPGTPSDLALSWPRTFISKAAEALGDIEQRFGEAIIEGET
jgi:hypothetical protein